MAGRFTESFDHVAFADLNKKWTSVNGGVSDASAITSVGRNGTNGLKLANGGVNSVSIRLVKAIPASGATAIFQMAFRSVTPLNRVGSGSGNVENLGTNQGDSGTAVLLSIRQAATTQVFFYLNQSGQIVCCRGTTTLGTSTALTQNAMHYLTIKVVINDATGTVDITKDGSSILALTGQDTKSTSSATWDEFAIGGVQGSSAGAVEWNIDDLIVMDGSGSYNNAVLSDQRVSARLMNAVGNSNQSTPSSGGADRYTMVDETTLNSDTDYNTFAAAADKDLYGFENCPISGATVSMVGVNMTARKADAGDASIAPVFRISGTDYDGPSFGVASSYLDIQSVHDRSIVDGTTQWTTAVLDAAEVGMKKAS